MVAIIWAPFGLSLIGSGQRPGCVYQRFKKMTIIFIRSLFEKTKRAPGEAGAIQQVIILSGQS
jgi:hypothetical protein